MITKVKGTHDILDMTLFNAVLAAIKKHVALYNFSEIATPLIEHTHLFERVLGAHTDVVTKQMFTLHSEKEDESLCLRPEATASVARAFVENSIMQLPWKVFTWGPMFRYERPQKGRYRQFYQVSMEVIGSAEVAGDAQFITMLDRLFSQALQIADYVLHINFLGCTDDRVAYTKKLQRFLAGNGLTMCTTCSVRAQENPLRVFDCKQEQCQQSLAQAPLLTESLCSSCSQEWDMLLEQLDLLSVTYSHNPRLVRGLDYYNKVAFEFLSGRLGSQSAFCGGGRYDNLIGMISGKETVPALGAALGLDRVLLLLEDQENLTIMPSREPLYVVIPTEKAYHPLALQLSDELQSHLFTTELIVDGSLKSALRKANKYGALYALLLGEQEHKEGTVTVKDMITGEQQTIAQIDIVSFLR